MTQGRVPLTQLHAVTSRLRKPSVKNDSEQVTFTTNGLDVPVATAVTNLDPKCPSGESRHMLGCLFWKSPAVMHSSALRK